VSGRSSPQSLPPSQTNAVVTSSALHAEPYRAVDSRLADERGAYSSPVGDQPLAAKGDLSDRRYGRLKTELRRSDEKGVKTGMTVVTFCVRLIGLNYCLDTNNHTAFSRSCLYLHAKSELVVIHIFCMIYYKQPKFPGFDALKRSFSY